MLRLYTKKQLLLERGLPARFRSAQEAGWQPALRQFCVSPVSRFSAPRKYHWPSSFCLALTVAACLLCGAAPVTLAQLPPTGGGGFLVFGRVYLPDGKPASKVKVIIELANGITREAITDDNGNYEFRGMTGGRYRLKASNPTAPEQYSDPAESDSTRSYSNRVQIHVYLRIPLHDKKAPLNPGIVSAARAAQNIPPKARKAFEEGLKQGKEKKTDEALKSFTEAIALFPDYFQALAERGTLLLQRNQLMEAATDFDHALKLNEKYAPALRGMGLCLLQTQHPAEAVELLRQAAVIEPDEALTQMFLGFAQLQLRQNRPAEAALQKALKLDSVRAIRARAYLAELYASENRFLEAANELRGYLAAQPNAPDAAKLKAIEAEWRARADKK
jgi:predicted Zn-dependent protease